VYASLLEGSVLGDEGAPGSRARLENRYGPVKEDATNVREEFYEFPSYQERQVIYPNTFIRDRNKEANVYV